MNALNHNMSYLLPMLFVSLSSFSQSTIDNVNMPLKNDRAIIKICSDIPDINALKSDGGAMKIWDFTNLNSIEDKYFDFIDPSKGLMGSDFTNSTIDGVSWQNSHSYYSVNKNGISVVGQVLLTSGSTSDTIIMKYSNSEQILNFPSNYNDNFKDSFEGVSKVMGFNVGFTGSTIVKADGYGTLKTPKGTFNNVIRYYVHRTQQNTLPGTPAQVKDQFFWVSSDYRFWLLLIENVFDGFSNSKLVWYNNNPAPIIAGINQTVKIFEAIYPNPCKLNSRINIRVPESSTSEINFYSLDGKKIYSETLHLSAGENELNIPISLTSNSIYTVEFKNKKLVQRIRLVILN